MNLKKILALFLALLSLSFSLAFLTACGGEDEDGAPYGMKLASDPALVDYFLYVPEDWVVTSATGTTMAQVSLSDATSVIVTNHTDPDFRPTTDAKKNLETYFESYKEKLIGLFDMVEEEGKEPVTSFTMVEEPTFITLKKGDTNVAAMRFSYTATLDEAKVQQLMVLAYEDDYFYNITFTTQPAVYQDNLQMFETILENFRFEG